MSDFSKEYGRALYDLAKEEKNVESILSELHTIDSVIKENKEYIKLIDTPGISLDERINIIEEAFFDCSLYVKNFIKILAEKKMFYDFSNCVKEFNKIYDEENNIERAEAVTCIPLKEEQLEKLKEKIEKLTGKTVYITNRVDTSILGGVVLKLKNTQYDGSIRQRLNALSTKIKGNTF